MPTSQKVQIDTFDFGPSLTAPTLGALATGTTIANGTANSCNEQSADSGVYIADFVGADASALIPAGTYRLRTTVNGLPLKRFVTFAGVDGEVVYARSEEHAVLDTATQDILTAITRGLIAGVVGSSSSTTVINVTSTESGLAVTDQLKGRVLIFNKDTTTAALRGQGAPIDTNDTTSITVASGDAFTTAPASGDTFTIY